MTKFVDAARAVSKSLSDGNSLYLGGFTHLIPFSIGHEIIRQKFEDLHLIRCTPDLIFDQMIAAGCATKLTFSWAGNPGVGSLRAIRRAVENGVPSDIEIDEYSHFGLVSRIAAGANDLPFLPVRSYIGTDFLNYSDSIKTVNNPYESGPSSVTVVPPLKPDVAVVRAQRADVDGNGQLWGISGDMVEASYAAKTTILSAEQVVENEVIRSDPNRTSIPGDAVDFVTEEPFGSYPSYAQGLYNRDNQVYLEWSKVSKTHESTLDWLDEWVFGVEDHFEYLDKIGTARFIDLLPKDSYATPVNMGGFRHP